MDEDEKDLFTKLIEAFLDKSEDGIFNPATATCQGAGADSRQCIASEEETLVDVNNNRPPKGYSVQISRTGSCSDVQANIEVQDSAQIGAEQLRRTAIPNLLG